MLIDINMSVYNLFACTVHKSIINYETNKRFHRSNISYSTGPFLDSFFLYDVKLRWFLDLKICVTR